MNRLFLLDGMALVYRAYFALIRSPIRTSKGFNTSAIYGFANTLIELLQNQAPTHLAVAFDTSHPTPRHEKFPAYKAQREDMPEDLSAALPYVKRLVEAFNIPVLESPGYEADDIIGTLARRAEAEGDFEVFMVTPDKDFAQLVTEHTKIYKPGRQGSQPEVLDLAGIKSQWQIKSPDQVVDILGLWGDTSDNIPGVPGIGEKTAKKLIEQYGSIENLLAHTGELKGKQKENLEAHGEQARLSRELVTIILDAPVDVDFEQLKVEPIDEEAVKALFSELEFNSLGNRLFGGDFKAGRGHEEKETLKTTDHDYLFIPPDDAQGRAKFIAELKKQKTFCFDTETSSLDSKTAQLVGLAFSWKKGEGAYVGLPTAPDQALKILEEFKGVLGNAGTLKVGHNLKFDLSVLLWNGVRVEGPFFDTMLAHSLVAPDQRHQMDYMSERYLGYTPVSISTLIGEKQGNATQLSMLDVVEQKAEEIAEYAAEDADVTWQLADVMRKELELKGQHQVFYDIESPLLPVLVDMEHEGVAIDTNILNEIGVSLQARMDELQAEIYQGAGREFNLNSPKQLGEILFDELNLVEKAKKTKTGQYVTNEQVLTSLAPHHKIVADILEYREATKLKSTYVDTLPLAVCARTGRVHTTFHQLMTATGRLASNNPNLQNIPIRTEQGREIRRAFVPRSEDYELMSADYSQIELRVMASLSGDPAMIEAFANGLDIHSATAARVYGVDLDDVLPEMRRTAKMVNFGIIYGISAFGLSQRLGIPRGEAARIIDEYFRQYAGVKTFMDQTIAEAKEKGYVETITGRRRYLPDINSGNATVRGAAERTAINTPIQGTAADMIKIAMVNVAEELAAAKVKSRMLLQVHDELLFDLHRSEREQLAGLVEAAMRDAIELKVPVVVEIGFGDNWLDAH